MTIQSQLTGRDPSHHVQVRQDQLCVSASSGRFARVHSSSRRSPCPVCGRTKDHDCRWTDSWIACHSGSSLKPGAVIVIAGQQWYLSHHNGGHCKRAALFKPHRQRLHAGRLQPAVDRSALSLEAILLKQCAQLRRNVHQVNRLPIWQHCTADDYLLVHRTFELVSELSDHLNKIAGQSVKLKRLQPMVNYWVKSVGYAVKDLIQFEASHLGNQPGVWSNHNER